MPIPSAWKQAYQQGRRNAETGGQLDQPVVVGLIAVPNRPLPLRTDQYAGRNLVTPEGKRSGGNGRLLRETLVSTLTIRASTHRKIVGDARSLSRPG